MSAHSSASPYYGRVLPPGIHLGRRKEGVKEGGVGGKREGGNKRCRRGREEGRDGF